MDYANGQLTAMRYRRGEVVLEEWQDGLRSFKADDPAPEYAVPTEPCACFTAMRQCSVLYIYKVSSYYPYSFDYNTGYGWRPYTFGTRIKLARVGDRVWLRAHDTFLKAYWNNESSYARVSMTGLWNVSGRIDALFARDGALHINSVLHWVDFSSRARTGYFFKGCTSLRGEVEMTITYGTLKGLFYNTRITRFSAPRLTVLYSTYTFRSCSALTSVSMPALRRADFGEETFLGCSALRELVFPLLVSNDSNYSNYSLGWNAFNGLNALRRFVMPLYPADREGQSSLAASAIEYVRLGAATVWGVTLPTTDSRTGDNLPTRTVVLHAGATVTTPTGWTRLTDTPAIVATGSEYSATRAVTITTGLSAANVASLGLTHTTAADIYYTTDGTVPSATNGRRYTGAFTIDAATAIKAIAINTEGEEHLICQSDVASASFGALHCLTFTATVAGSTFSLVEEGSMTDAPALEYSTDGATWQTLSYSSAITLANVGDFAHIRAAQGTTNVFWESSANRAHFAMTGGIEASGSVLSLIDADWCDDTVATGLTQPYQLAGLFFGCGAALLSAPELPAVTATEGCYYAMFEGCSALTGRVRIRLAALGTSSCARMFYGCAALYDIWADFAAWTADGTTDWVAGVDAKGMFTDDNLTSLAFGTSAIPEGWSYRCEGPIVFMTNAPVTTGDIEAD